MIKKLAGTSKTGLFFSVPLVFIFMLTACIGAQKYLTSKKPSLLVCLGDSLMTGHGAVTPGADSMEKSCPALLQNKINIPVINAGVSGNTTAQGLSRVSSDVLSKNPGIIIIGLGANDLLQRIPLPATQDNLQKIINMVKSENRKIYLVKFYTSAIAREMLNMLHILCHDEQSELIRQYDYMFNSLAASNNAELIEDIWSGVWGIHMSDGIHPNEEGYKIMAENYFNALKPYLAANDLLKQKENL